MSSSHFSLISGFSRGHIFWRRPHFNKLKLAVRQYVEEFAAVSPTSGPVTGCLQVDEAYNGDIEACPFEKR